MKVLKFALAAAALAASFSASAEWFLVVDGTTGSRLLGENGSLISTVNKNGTLIIGGKFVVVDENGSMGTPFTVLVAQPDCAKGSGELIWYIDGIDGNKKQYWAKDGSKFYDFEAVTICNGYFDRQERLKKEKEQEKASKTPAKAKGTEV
jgi:hypothetical protein